MIIIDYNRFIIIIDPLSDCVCLVIFNSSFLKATPFVSAIPMQFFPFLCALHPIDRVKHILNDHSGKESRFLKRGDLIQTEQMSSVH